MLNESCVAIWDYYSRRECFLGMTCKKIGKDGYLTDYLERLFNVKPKKMLQYLSKKNKLIYSFVYSNFNYCGLAWHFSSCKTKKK